MVPVFVNTFMDFGYCNVFDAFELYAFQYRLKLIDRCEEICGDVYKGGRHFEVRKIMPGLTAREHGRFCPTEELPINIGNNGGVKK